MKVCKFGGTSMATPQSLKQLKDIILSDNERKFIVVSAPGKRFKGDTKITDLLYKSHNERGIMPSLTEISNRFKELCKELKVKLDIDALIKDISKTLINQTTTDYIASRGEYLSAKLMAEFLGFEFVDAGDIIKFKQDGTFDKDSTNDLVQELKTKTKGVVIPGFYGRLPNKDIKTFSRGGSDVTGAIIARGINATVYENWTDVDGFMAADPTIVNNPKTIDTLSFEELRELSYMGANVLHPESIFPLLHNSIPVNIKNSFNPSAKGTFIVKDVSHIKDRPVVTGIAGHKGSCTINIHKSLMNSEIGFGRRVLSVIERHGLSFEHIPTGIDTMSIVLSTDISKEIEEKLSADILGKVNPDTIDVTHNLALIAVVGHGMAQTKGVAARLFNAVFNADINIKMIDQGSSEMNIIIGVEEKDYEKTIKAIYSEFFA